MSEIKIIKSSELERTAEQTKSEEKEKSAAGQKKEQEKGILKNFFQKLKKVKHIEIYLAVFFIALVLLIYFLPSFNTDESSGEESQLDYTSGYEFCYETEQRLEKILSKIENIGEVNVMINYESTPELVIAYIISRNTSSSGESGSTQETITPQIIYTDGEELPIILKQITPVVTGVLVVAEGADNIKVKVDIINAIMVLLDIEYSKITVLS